MVRLLPALLCCLLLLPETARAVAIYFSLPGSTTPMTSITLGANESTQVAVVVSDVPSQGLAAFQFEVLFDPAAVALYNPNEAFRGTIYPFAPLGGNPFCAIVRGTTTCEDPQWFLTSTGRIPFGLDEIDNTAGRILIAYATAGAQNPPSGTGTIALIDVSRVGDAETTLTLANIILADNADPPTSFPTTPTDLVVVPEPSTLLMLALGVFGIAHRRARPR